MNARFNSVVINNPKSALAVMFLAIVIACIGFKNFSFFLITHQSGIEDSILKHLVSSHTPSWNDTYYCR